MNFSIGKNSGFTLIEMMVSIAIFSIIMTISMGALLNIIDINRKSQSVKTIMNNLSFALEDMARDIRFGTGYSCTGSCDTLSLQFQGVRDTAPRNILYSKVGPDANECYMVNKTADNGTPVALTAPEACITNLSFIVKGQGVGDTLQPRVLITLSGHAGSGKTQTDFKLQTTVSRRQLEVQ